VLGISRDSMWSHRSWAEALGIDFQLLSDWSGDATRAFGVAGETLGMQDVPRRTVFLIEAGTIRRSWSSAAPGALPDVDELLAALRPA
jgi:peroxiredoxin